MYHSTSKGLAALGRHGDDTLLHVSKKELAGLENILGPLSTNPKTGMPEAYGWANALGSVASGVGSFGIGAALEPLVGSMVGEDSGVIGEILQKALPAVAGAGVGAAVGGVTGGKAGAMGGAAQGLLSGGIGAYASEDLLGTPYKAYAPDAQEALPEKMFATEKLPSVGEPSQYNQIQQDLFKTPDILNQQAPDMTEKVNMMREDQATQEQPGFFGNLQKLGSKLTSKEGLKGYEDYLPYLLQAGGVGAAITSGQESTDAAQQAQNNAAAYQLAKRRQADELARSTYGANYRYGYADGGPVVMQTQGAVPIRVTIPEPLVNKVKDSGGLGAYVQQRAQGMDNFATGGYVNTQPFNPQDFHPQSRISGAQPYAAAGNTRVVNTLAHGASFEHGGLIDGHGDGMSDDIDANIDGQEPVRVADGEYVVPKHIAEMLGADKLDELLKRVRRAAYGSDEQVREGAGLRTAKQELGLA